MSKEVRIAIVAILTVGVTIWGYIFLKGRNLLSPSTNLYVEYPDAKELSVSTPVYINGFQIGVVTDMYLKPKDMRTIVVVLNINKGVEVPKSAIAQIATTGLMGSKAIRILFDKPCSGSDCAENGDYLRGETAGMIRSMITPGELGEYMDHISSGVNEIMDSLIIAINDPKNPNNIGKSLKDVQQTLINLRAATAKLDQLLGASAGSISGILKNLETVSGTLKASNNNIKNILSNVDSFSVSLKSMPLDHTLGSATDALNEIRKTVVTADTAIAGLNTIIARIKNGEGSIGELLANDSLYTNLNATLTHAQLLMQDIRLNPKRYTRILSSKQIPYALPANDPALKK